MNADEMAAFVDGIITKSGGIDKWRQLSLRLRNVKAKADAGEQGGCQRFLRIVADGSEEGSRQLIAIALLGLTLGEVVHEGRKARKRKQAERN